VIPGQYISRQHATLIHKDGYFYITDNNSSNGVKVNGKKINMQERISNGVKVSFGPYETVFHTVGITSAEPLPNSNDEKTRLNR
jgi:pSer/pThr/pTyr-binding forkhead associated (FHA) protein